jgi:hypothetical protein
MVCPPSPLGIARLPWIQLLVPSFMASRLHVFPYQVTMI